MSEAVLFDFVRRVIESYGSNTKTKLLEKPRHDKTLQAQKEPQQGRHYSSHTLSHYPHSFTLDQHCSIVIAQLPYLHKGDV